MKKSYVLILVFVIFSALAVNTLLAQEKVLTNDTIPIEQQDFQESIDLKNSQRILV